MKIADILSRVTHSSRRGSYEVNKNNYVPKEKTSPPGSDVKAAVNGIPVIQSSTCTRVSRHSHSSDVTAVADRGRKMAAASLRPKRRLVQKNGDVNVGVRNVTRRKLKFLVDLFTTIVDLRWRWHVIAFVTVFVATWTAFGGIWLAIAYGHGDVEQHGNDSWEPCIFNVYDYPSALLFSLETQSTIGYGYRVLQSECSVAIVFVMIQSCIGMFIQTLATGIIFSKISRPKGRAQTILFSERAVICKRDGQYCLLFRVGDMRRRSHIIGTSIRALLVRSRLTEGESIPVCQYPLALETETSHQDSFVFLVWPVTVVHRIDACSPLWDVSAEDLLIGTHFEIIVILEGTIEPTGRATQVRTSYIPDEIVWGHRLHPLINYERQNGRYEIDYSQFHQTIPISMPECSARSAAAADSSPPSPSTILTKLSGPDEDNDYPVSFTLPGVRPNSTSTSLSLRRLFSRSDDLLTDTQQQQQGSSDGKSSRSREEKSVPVKGLRFEVTRVGSCPNLLPNCNFEMSVAEHNDNSDVNV